jgi:hypothetical protein
MVGVAGDRQAEVIRGPRSVKEDATDDI